MESKIYSVSELTSTISAVFQEAFPFSICVRGEIADLRPSSAGHFYFSLVDESARVACVMFKSQTFKYAQYLKKGDGVIISGTVNVYAAGGSFSIIVKTVEPAGEGLRKKELIELKNKLEAEGLFAAERKRVLPFLPRTIGVVTAKTGAAVRDIVRIIRRRNPYIDILLSPCAVQGEHAPLEIAEALARLNISGKPDVIIIGRGGGGSDDLSAFNNELVVRAVASSTIPVVSAVGHQIDITLTDLAADARAETPSAAAELIVREEMSLGKEIREKALRCNNALAAIIALDTDDLRAATNRLLRESPERRHDELQLKADDLLRRMELSVNQSLRIAGEHIVTNGHALKAAAVHLQSNKQSEYERKMRSFFTVLPAKTIDIGLDNIHRLRFRLADAMKDRMNTSEELWKSNAALLTERNPLNVLGRGYARLRNDAGSVVSVDEVNVGDILHADLKDGTITVDVTEKRKGPYGKL